MSRSACAACPPGACRCTRQALGCELLAEGLSPWRMRSAARRPSFRFRRRPTAPSNPGIIGPVREPFLELVPTQPGLSALVRHPEQFAGRRNLPPCSHGSRCGATQFDQIAVEHFNFGLSRTSERRSTGTPAPTGTTAMHASQRFGNGFACSPGLRWARPAPCRRRDGLADVGHHAEAKMVAGVVEDEAIDPSPAPCGGRGRSSGRTGCGSWWAWRRRCNERRDRCRWSAPRHCRGPA